MLALALEAEETTTRQSIGCVYIQWNGSVDSFVK